MFADLPDRIIVSLLVGVLVNAGFAAESKDDGERQKYPLSVKLIDVDANPIEGAKAGVGSGFGNKEVPNRLVDETGWGYWYGAKLKSDGAVNFSNGGDRYHLCVVARHAGRKLVGVWKLDTDKVDPEKTTKTVIIILHPKCRTSGRLICSDLTSCYTKIRFFKLHT